MSIFLFITAFLRQLSLKERLGNTSLVALAEIVHVEVVRLPRYVAQHASSGSKRSSSFGTTGSLKVSDSNREAL